MTSSSMVFGQKVQSPLANGYRIPSIADDVFQQLSLAPNLGRKRDAIQPGLRSHPVARHLAFYIQQKDKIIVLRILHPRMNVDEAFKSA